MSSCKPSPILTHMPWPIKKEIIENLDFIEKLALRVTCKEFKRMTAIRPQNNCSRLCLKYFRHQSIEIDIKREGKIKKIEYSRNAWSASREIRWMPATTITRTETVDSAKFIEEAVSCFGDLVANPNLEVEVLTLSICVDERINTCYTEKLKFIRTLKKCLSSLKIKLKVKSFFCLSDTSSDALTILPFLDCDVQQKFGCFSSGEAYAHTLSSDEWFNIPHTTHSQIDVKDIPRLFKHFKESWTFECFHTTRLTGTITDLSELFGETINWQLEDNGARTATVPTSDPDFVLDISYNLAHYNTALFIRRMRV